MLLRFHHIDLAVRDLEEFAEFLKTLGFEEVRRTEHGGAAIEMRLPGDNQVFFDFHAVGGDEQPGVKHIAFLVDDPVATAAEIESKGLKLEGGGFLPRGLGINRLTANLRDPMGFRFQLTQPLTSGTETRAQGSNRTPAGDTGNPQRDRG